MDYITIVGSNYEDAVKKARKQYGDKLRIHSRKEVTKSNAFGFGKTTVCEIKCFLAEEQVMPVKPKEISEPEVKEIPQKSFKEEEETQTETSFDFFLDLASKILRANDFSESYISYCVNEVKEQLVSLNNPSVTEEDLELILLDKIVGSVNIDYKSQEKPSRICVVLGPRASGKTTCVAKLAATFNMPSENRRNVRIVTLDDSPAVMGQFNKLASALEINVDAAKHESELEDVLNPRLGNELVIVDTFGKEINNSEPDYRLYGLMNVADQGSTSFFITVPATMKNSDISEYFEQYKHFNIGAIIVTKLDETTTVGNVISISHEKNIPLLFVTDGKKIPKDIHKASVSDLMGRLKNLRIDVNRVLSEEN